LGMCTRPPGDIPHIDAGIGIPLYDGGIGAHGLSLGVVDHYRIVARRWEWKRPNDWRISCEPRPHRSSVDARNLGHRGSAAASAG
jgi:hypothetical protein